jgi:peptide chain release factor 2
MSRDDGDEDGLMHIESDVARLDEIVKGLEFRRMFNNPADPLNCLCRHSSRCRRHRGL